MTLCVYACLCIAAREEKRRITAPGDLLSGPSGTAASMTSPSGPSASSPVGPLTAAAHRRPSIFHRRAATAAAAAAAAAASAGSVSAAGQQPLIAVPSNDYEVAGVQAMDGGSQRSVASTPAMDSPAPEQYGLLPPPLLAGGALAGALGGDGGGASTPAAAGAAAAAGAEAQELSLHAKASADDAASLSSMAASGAALAAAAATDASLAPVLLSQGTACDWSVVVPLEALGLRYGTVRRSRLARVGITIPYPGAALSGIIIGAAAGAAVGGVVPSAAAGAGPGVAAAGYASGAATPGSHTAATGTSSNVAVAGRPRLPPVRSIKFKHVRFNRMHARLTYESPALSIRNFGLVLDNRVYRNIDGGWKTVLNRWAENWILQQLFTSCWCTSSCELSNRHCFRNGSVHTVKFVHSQHSANTLVARQLLLRLSAPALQCVGSWHRYKWDVVRSLLKSATGLQAKKLQELQIPNFGADPPDTLELRSSAGFKAGIMSLLKGRKGRGAKLRLGSSAAAGEGNFSDELEGLAAGSVVGELGGEEGPGVADVEGAGAGAGGADYLELMRSALRMKHKQRKMQLLLGNVPPLPQHASVAVVLG